MKSFIFQGQNSISLLIRFYSLTNVLMDVCKKSSFTGIKIFGLKTPKMTKLQKSQERSQTLSMSETNVKTGEALSFKERMEKIKQGGHPKYHEKNKQQGKLFARERLKLLFDDGLLVEDGLYTEL